MIIEFDVPFLPKTPNSMGKASIWSSHKERHRWRELIAHYSDKRLNELKETITIPFHKANLVLTRCSSREPDIDNLYASFKFVIDALKFCGIIIDDKPSVITLQCKWEKVKNKEGKIKVKVELAK